MAFELMAPLMFVSLAALLLLGYPVAFALAANGLLFAFIGFELGLLQPELLQALPQRLFGIMQNPLLLAIPFFTFMGLILERSGMAEDLLDTIGQLFGPVRGGVAYDAPIPIDWEGRVIGDGPEFEASFEGGAWQILIYAC